MLRVMSPSRLTNFRLDTELLDALQRIKDRDGVPISEQVRRALIAWLETKGEAVGGSKKTERKQAATRKRS